jgi:TolA-binding protein
MLLLIALCLYPLTAPAGKKDDAKTIDSLAGHETELPPDPPITDAERLARDSYRRFVELSGADPGLAAEALRRLGDLELEAGEADALDRGADQLHAPTYAKAVELYRRLLAEHPDFPQNDLVLYQLARAQESSGDALAALATLDQLVAEHPRTAALNEAQFRRGEILFSHGRYEEAEHAYSAVLALDAEAGHPGEFHDQSLYKRGWSLFKQDRYDDDLASFFELLDGRFANVPAADVDHHIDSLSRPARELIDDSLRVMSLSFANMEGEKSLRQKMQQKPDLQYAHLLYLSLAALYMDQKRYSDAAGVLTAFVDARPLHPRAPYLYMQAVSYLEEGKFPSEVLAAREGFVRRFGLDQPFWKAQTAPPDDPSHAPVVAYLRDSVWMLAQHYHALAQAQAKDKEATRADREQSYRLAADWYRRYVVYFPHDAQTPNCQFLLGEVLFESGDYAGAVVAYEASAYNYPPHAHSAEAAYASLLAYQRHEASLTGDDKKAWHQQSLDAELRFANSFPNDARAIEARVNAAEGLYAIGALKDAIAAATPVTEAPNGTAAQRRVAWMVIGHANFDDKDFTHAEAAYLEVRKLDQAAGRRDAQVSERIAASIYRQGELARDAGKPAEAAMAFLRVGRTVPEASIRTAADYDAAKAYLAAGKTEEAIPVLQAFRRNHPDSPLADQATANLALAYVQTKDTAAAAAEFERIADSPGASKDERKEALQQAAKLYRERNDAANEGRILALFIKRYPESFDETLEARQRLLELAQAGHDQTAVLDLSKQLIAVDANAGKKRTDRSRYLAAHATLNLARPARQAFLDIALKAPLKESMRRKKARMEEALAAYGKAADYGVADVLTEATFELGELYNALAKALYASERPKGLDADASEQYDTLLQEQAFPFEEKAIELHEANAKRAHEGIYDDWVRKSYASLAALKPARYARPDHGEAYVEAWY